jgi:hypothetical protein
MNVATMRTRTSAGGVDQLDERFRRGTLADDLEVGFGWRRRLRAVESYAVA